MSDRRLSTGKIAVFVLIGLIGAAGMTSWMMMPAPASAQACQAHEGALGNFALADEAVAAPDTVFKDEDGNDKRLSDLKGRAVVLNFWATWCAPCVREMPQLDRLKSLVAGNGIEVLAVSEDRKGVPLVKNFYATNKLYDLDIYVDEGGKLLRALKGRGLPTTVLFDRQGREVGRVTGIAEWDSAEVVAYLRNCLAG